MSREVDPARAGDAPAGSLVLRTLTDHRPFELIACCAACERYVVLDPAALAACFGWDGPLDALRRRMMCRQCGARTGSVLISVARGRDAEGPQAVQGGEGMTEWDHRDRQQQEPVRVEDREQFDEAVGELFRTGRPIEAPSLDALDDWGVDLEDEEGAIEEAR